MLKLNGLPVPTTMFPDNTSQVWKLPVEILNETNYAHITWEFSNEGEFMQLAQLKMLLDAHGIAAGLKLKYLPYGRQDKSVSNDATFALRTFARQLNSLNFLEVLIADPHSEIAVRLIERSTAVYPIGQMHEAKRAVEADILCYPDHGAVNKYSKIYVSQDYLEGSKTRDQATGQITHYSVIGNPAGKKVLIVDDICDGGATFQLLAKELLNQGAKSVALFVTHGIFSKGTRCLFDAGISRVFTADGEVGPRTATKQV